MPPAIHGCRYRVSVLGDLASRVNLCESCKCSYKFAAALLFTFSCQPDKLVCTQRKTSVQHACRGQSEMRHAERSSFTMQRNSQQKE